MWKTAILSIACLAAALSCGAGQAVEAQKENDVIRFKTGVDQAAIAKQRRRMVERQIQRRGVVNQHVLQAMQEVPRHLFVPEDQRGRAYDDYPLPIGYNQTISQPYIVGLMTELLEPAPGDTVLEIGTGSGYQAAVLSRVVSHVYSIEIVDPLCERARTILADQGYTNVTVLCGDGYDGWPEHAPFDGIILTAAPEQVPRPLLDQLVEGGRLVVPEGRHNQDLVVYEKRDGQVRRRSVIPVRFVPMTGKAEGK